ncbi:MAG: transketolase family protein [Bacillota bacterium]
MVAPREAYGDTLVELGKEDTRIVVLDADLSASTKTDKFRKAYPDRFFNMGIAESNMMAVAAGLAQSGKIAFASTFAVFATGRTYDQIRQSIAYPRFNVKIVATHGGLTVGPDGASHQALEDVALMRALPGMVVIVPADVAETKAAVRAAAAHDGPAYIRLGREAVPDVLPQGAGFEIGKSSVLWPAIGREAIVAAPKGPTPRFDLTFAACGVMVKPCLDAAKELEAQGIKCAVANFSSVKPMDTELLLALARESKAIVTAEEHSVVGGLGGAVAETLSAEQPILVRRVGVQDRFGESGPAEDLLRAYGLTAKDVAEAGRAALAAAK